MNIQNYDNLTLVYFGVMAIMVLIWLIGVWFALSKFKNTGLISGKALSDFNYDEISRKIASAITRNVNTMFSGQITEQTSSKLNFTINRTFSKIFAELYFAKISSGVEVVYALDIRKPLGNLKIITYIVCFIYCLIFIAGVPVLLWFLVVNNPDPTIKMQTFQIFQMVHGAWPPFLMGSIVSFRIKYYQNFINYLLQYSKYQ